MSKRALIVVDMQNDFVLPTGALYVPDAETIIHNINKAMNDTCYDIVIGTQDFHPKGHKSFASNHPEEYEEGDVIDLNGLDQILWPDHCVQDTEGAEFVKGLNVEKFDRVFQKGMNPEVDSYSAFYDNGHLEDTGLTEYLRSTHISQVAIVGVALDFCIKYTALDAVEEGFQTILLWECTKGVGLEDGHIANTAIDLLENGVNIFGNPLGLP